MSAIYSITPDKLSRLTGTAACPVLVDVRTDEDFEADPHFIPRCGGVMPMSRNGRRALRTNGRRDLRRGEGLERPFALAGTVSSLSKERTDRRENRGERRCLGM